jgi:hypothetical protein
MLRAYATELAIASAVLIVLLSGVFALIQNQ